MGILYGGSRVPVGVAVVVTEPGKRVTTAVFETVDGLGDADTVPVRIADRDLVDLNDLVEFEERERVTVAVGLLDLVDVNRADDDGVLDDAKLAEEDGLITVRVIVDFTDGDIEILDEIDALDEPDGAQESVDCALIDTVFTWHADADTVRTTVRVLVPSKEVVLENEADNERMPLRLSVARAVAEKVRRILGVGVLDREAVMVTDLFEVDVIDRDTVFVLEIIGDFVLIPFDAVRRADRDIVLVLSAVAVIRTTVPVGCFVCVKEAESVGVLSDDPDLSLESVGTTIVRVGVDTSDCDGE
jgi:hypothetical protein